MDWGMKNRLSQIIKPATGRTVMLAVDHGYFLGPTRKLEHVGNTVEPLLPYADALMLTRGILRSSIRPEISVPIVLRVSGGSSIIGADLSNETITTSMEDAIRLNVAAVALSIFIGTDFEHQTLENLAFLIDMAQEYGIPVLAVTAVGKEIGKKDSRFLALACRIAAELGASFVKTYYCDDFEKIIESCPIPVVIAGGPKLDTDLDAFKLAYDAVQKGATGVDMGRNIWQSEFPVAKIKAVRAIVHDKADPKQAFEIFEENKKK
ncbi:MAG: 3-hydroxy-5-phosphonooxypentane-2,4-dione thiolase [Candidatus Aminicenantes bacterium]|nr:3-hydroxy-5-phosphonooxypentane-2,4-dione thiolase [Candidatus Aminicenantes bacterium]